jgi:uncharacterized membrane protein
MLDALTPFHPRFVHFPIALSLVGALFLAFGLIRRRERWIGYGQISLLIGWLGVMAAVATGLIDQSAAPDDAAIHAVINQHITAGIALLIAVALALYWPLRNKRLLSEGNARWGYIGLLILIVALVAIEGWLGGKLVYHYHVGIQ